MHALDTSIHISSLMETLSHTYKHEPLRMYQALTLHLFLQLRDLSLLLFVGFS